MSSSVAHNFAKALVELAREKNILQQVQNHAEYLMDGLSLTDVKLFLGNPRINSSIKKEFIRKLILTDSPQEFTNMLDLVIDRHYGRSLGAIMEKVIDLSIEAQGYEIVTVISTELLSETEQSAIHAKLEKLWSVRLFLKHRLNPGLLGGAVILRGDKLYDGSLAGQLNSLRQRLLTEID